jgi:acetyl-CoA C-acetyltransferase
MEEVVIVSAVRTPVGSFGGQFKDVPATELGAHAVHGALSRAGIVGDEVDEVLLGCVLQSGLGQNPARQAAMAAGIPHETPATTVNMVCGSGLKAVALASQIIRAGDADVVVAGGMENMSRAPYLSHATRTGARMGDATLVDSMIHDGLWDAFGNVHMGITAENVAEQFGISRDEQDAFAVASQHKAGRALDQGVFDAEIVGVENPSKTGPVLLSSDEHPRPDTTVERLGRLRPAFRREDGTVTAGNASGLNDGAAAVVLMSARRATELGSEPLAHVESHASVGLDPSIMGIGPVPAVRRALERAGLELADVDVFELNEAFAAQAVAVQQELGVDPDRINPHGGAIALGHPIGASGGRILVTLLHELHRTGATRGVAALCVGGGLGQAIVVRNGASGSNPSRRR